MTAHARGAKDGGDWVVNQWIKKAVLLSFRLENNSVMDAGDGMRFYDKVPGKFASYTADDFARGGFRVVPGAVARRGSFIAKNVVLMPSFVNIGAFVDEGTMVDAWATVGSCAQIGKNVHLSGGVGIGGVLEPMQANPTIIEDNCFIGARSEIVEGVIVEENSVISMGVYIGQSTKIYDRATGEVTYGRVPSGSVVVSATCRPTTASTACIAPSSSSGSTPRRAPRPASTNCCAGFKHTICTRRPMMAMDRLFQLMKEKNASDMFFAVNSPVHIKINGNLIPINQQKLEPENIAALLAEIATPEQMEELARTMSSTWASRWPTWGASACRRSASAARSRRCSASCRRISRRWATSGCRRSCPN